MAREIVFEWDQWNRQKNEVKHGVSRVEAESAFFDAGYRLFRDQKHSLLEQRFILFGRSIENRILMIGFTLRGERVRVITARPASRRERAVYEQEKKE